MIVAPIFVSKEGEETNWGAYRFDQLPSPGDRINIMDYRERVQRLRVVYIAHEPMKDIDPPDSDRQLSFIHAEWIDEFY